MLNKLNQLFSKARETVQSASEEVQLGKHIRMSVVLKALGTGVGAAVAVSACSHLPPLTVVKTRGNEKALGGIVAPRKGLAENIGRGEAATKEGMTESQFDAEFKSYVKQDPEDPTKWTFYYSPEGAEASNEMKIGGIVAPRKGLAENIGRGEAAKQEKMAEGQFDAEFKYYAQQNPDGTWDFLYSPKRAVAMVPPVRPKPTRKRQRTRGITRPEKPAPTVPTVKPEPEPEVEPEPEGPKKRILTIKIKKRKKAEIEGIKQAMAQEGMTWFPGVDRKNKKRFGEFFTHNLIESPGGWMIFWKLKPGKTWPEPEAKASETRSLFPTTTTTRPQPEVLEKSTTSYQIPQQPSRNVERISVKNLGSHFQSVIKRKLDSAYNMILKRSGEVFNYEALAVIQLNRAGNVKNIKFTQRKSKKSKHVEKLEQRFIRIFSENMHVKPIKEGFPPIELPLEFKAPSF